MASDLLWLRLLLVCCIWAAFVQPGSTQANIDGGRSDLPGMKQDIFDQVQKSKKAGAQQRGKAPPECPKSDMMSPFYSLAYSGHEVYVRINSSEGKCLKLISVGGANFSMLTNVSRTCGPAGEWKRRIAENMSSMFFQGGWDWVKNENDTIEVVTDEGTFEAIVSEEKYEAMMTCWKSACGCEQANNPLARGVFIAMLCVAIAGLGNDAFKALYQKIVGKKPPKHAECKNGHRMEEVKLADRHYCDLCSARGTTYQCSSSCNYDMCKKCYKEKKKTVKEGWEKWCETHPEDKKKSKKEKDDDDDGKKSDTEDKEKSDTEDKEKSNTDTEKEESGKDTDTESKAEDPKDTSGDDTGKEGKEACEKK